MSELVFENKKWAIYKAEEAVYIYQAGPFGHSSYAFISKSGAGLRPHDYFEKTCGTNYPLDKIPNYIVKKAFKIMESLYERQDAPTI